MWKVLSWLEEMRQTTTTADGITKTHLDQKMRHPIYEVGCHLVCSTLSDFRNLSKVSLLKFLSNLCKVLKLNKPSFKIWNLNYIRGYLRYFLGTDNYTVFFTYQVFRSSYMHQFSTYFRFVHTAMIHSCIHSLSLEVAKYCFCNTLLSICQSAVFDPHKTTEMPSF
jgi:hypothetical protein